MGINSDIIVISEGVREGRDPSHPACTLTRSLTLTLITQSISLTLTLILTQTLSRTLILALTLPVALALILRSITGVVHKMYKSLMSPCGRR